jgi:hypothetical protein
MRQWRAPLRAFDPYILNTDGSELASIVNLAGMDCTKELEDDIEALAGTGSFHNLIAEGAEAGSFWKLVYEMRAWMTENDIRPVPRFEPDRLEFDNPEQAVTFKLRWF